MPFSLEAQRKEEERKRTLEAERRAAEEKAKTDEFDPYSTGKNFTGNDASTTERFNEAAKFKSPK